MKRTILIAEDEEKMRRILEVNLKDQYQILLAKDGEEALRLFKENEINLLLSDMKRMVSAYSRMSNNFVRRFP
jgi:DNA-binding NtrC family response regulator